MTIDTYGFKDQHTAVPATNAVEVTPSDSVDLENTARALYIGVTGDVSVQMKDTPTVTTVFRSVPVGILPIRVVRVNAADTTAADIISLF